MLRKEGNFAMGIVKMLTALTLCATMFITAGVEAWSTDTAKAEEIEVKTAET